jgi:hypothetical protein
MLSKQLADIPESKMSVHGNAKPNSPAFHAYAAPGRLHSISDIADSNLSAGSSCMLR